MNDFYCVNIQKYLRFFSFKNEFNFKNKTRSKTRIERKKGKSGIYLFIYLFGYTHVNSETSAYVSSGSYEIALVLGIGLEGLLLAVGERVDGVLVVADDGLQRFA